MNFLLLLLLKIEHRRRIAAGLTLPRLRRQQRPIETVAVRVATEEAAATF